MRFFSFLFFFAITFSGIGQDIYSIIQEDDEIIVSYSVLEWKKKGVLLPELRFSIENKTDHAINVSFELNFEYEMEIAEATVVEDICILAGKTKKGKYKGLFYQPENLTIDQLKSEDFYINLDELSITEVVDCK
jgi:hypothetical protein